jgi:SPP1 gp7 family putative phage head morphogenesis protein
MQRPIYFADARRRRRASIRIHRPDIVVSQRASREAIDTQLDLEKMLAVAVTEQARYFRDIAGPLRMAAALAFDRGTREVHAPLDIYIAPYEHRHRVAKILAATRVLGQARVLKEAGLPMDLGRAEFAELLGRIGVEQAVEYLRSLPVATRAEWERLVGASQKTAFTAAGIENKAALEALKRLVTQALKENWSRPEFLKESDSLLRTFETEAGSLRTLWNTVTATALARGRKEMLDDPDVKKVVSWRLYDAILDFRTRPNHRRLDGGIAPADWQGWDFYGPPNGFNCRCTLIGITEARAMKLLADGGGYFNLSEGVPANAGPDVGFEKAA